MAASYTVGFASVAAAAGAAYATLHTGASYRARIREVGLFVNAATASSVQLIRPNNTPVASTSILGQTQDPGDPASTINVDTAWSTAPTIGTNVPLRKGAIPAAIGNGLVWTWPADQPLIVPVSSWLVLWNYGAGAGSVLNCWITWEE